MKSGNYRLADGYVTFITKFDRPGIRIAILVPLATGIVLCWEA